MDGNLYADGVVAIIGTELGGYDTVATRSTAAVGSPTLMVGAAVAPTVGPRSPR